MAAAKKAAKKQAGAKKSAPKKPATRAAAGTKRPAKKAAAKKPAAKKAPAKKPAAKKPAAKKAPAKKTTTKTTAATRRSTSSRTTSKKKTTSTMPKKASTKKAAAKRAAAKQPPAKPAAKKAPANKAAAKKPAAMKPAAKKSPAKKAAKKTAAKTRSAVAGSNLSILSNARPEMAELPKPRGVSKDGIAYTKDFDVKFLKAQRAELEARRAAELARATRLEDEAESLIEDGEMGDVQFDDEGGEGDTMVVQRDLDRVLSSQARQTIEEIDAALARIEQGTYGSSEVSGQPIPRERLEALPETTVLAAEKVSGIGPR